jgi:hypothetical protein
MQKGMVAPHARSYTYIHTHTRARAHSFTTYIWEMGKGGTKVSRVPGQSSAVVICLPGFCTGLLHLTLFSVQRKRMTDDMLN